MNIQNNTQDLARVSFHLDLVLEPSHSWEGMDHTTLKGGIQK